MKTIYIIILGLVLTFSSSAKPRYEFTPALKTAYQNILSLRLKEGAAQLNQLKKSDPENLMIWFVEDYIDFLVIFINESEAEYDRLSVNQEIRLKKLQSGDPSSPYYLYTQAEVRLHWAISKTKFGSYLPAFNGVSKAYSLLEENQRKFPKFIANKKSLGAMHALVGTIPDKYKWGVKLISGLNGTIAQGMREIEEVIQYTKKTPFEFEEEVLVEYAFLVLHLNNQSDNAWKIMNSGKLNPQQSSLACFALANVAMKTGHNEEAIKMLQNAPSGPEYHPFWYLKFMLGNAKLSRMDADADKPLLQFLQNFKGRFAIKEAYMKLAWHSLINNKVADYQKYVGLCKKHGTSIAGGDKNAQKEAESGITPDMTLLKARIMFDGGYHQRALDVLNTRTVESYKSKRFQLEYTYRKGRILHLLKRYPDALAAYQNTIDDGRNEPFYFACNAALQAGEICETQQQNAKARQYFNTCLAIHPDDYADALHAKAKAGLGRLKK